MLILLDIDELPDLFGMIRAATDPDCPLTHKDDHLLHNRVCRLLMATFFEVKRADDEELYENNELTLVLEQILTRYLLSTIPREIILHKGIASITPLNERGSVILAIGR